MERNLGGGVVSDLGRGDFCVHAKYRGDCMGIVSAAGEERVRAGAMTRAMSALGSVHGARALRVARVEQGRIVAERLVVGRLSVGTSEKADVVAAGVAAFDLFEERDGLWYLRVEHGVRGKLSDERGARDVGDEAGVMLLSPQARGRLVVGSATILFQLVLPAPVTPRPQLPASVRGGLVSQIDWTFTAFASITMMSFFATLLALENADWAITLDHVERIDRVLLDFTAPEPPPEPAATWAQRDPLEDMSPANQPPAPTNEPSPVREPSPATRSSSGRRPASTESTSALAENTATAVAQMLGSLGNEQGAFADLLQGGAPSGDQQAVFDVVNGVTAVASNDRLAVRDTVRTEPSGPIGLDGLIARVPRGPVDEGSELVERPPGEVIFDPDEFEPDVPEEFDDELVLRRVRGKQRVMQRCYENELGRTPTLEGRVTIELTVMPAGNVRSRSVDNGTGSGSLGRCMTTALDTIRFSEGPRSPVGYRFPFVFAPQR